MDFTSRQVRAFLLVAQHQNFTRAAEALFITPSGLSVLIRELESQLGFRLFDRTTRHVALTTQGSQLLGVAKRSLEELEATVSHIGRTVKETNQSFSLGALPLMAANVLPQAIKEFRIQRPQVRIQVFDGELLTILGKVEAGALDMGLGAFEKRPSIRRVPFFRFSLMVIRPDNETAPRRATTTWSALKGERLLAMPSTIPLQQLIDKHLAQAGVVWQPAMVLNRLDTLIAMVEAGEGVGIIPSHGLPTCRNRKVFMSRLINPTVTQDYHLIRNRGRQITPVAEEFTSFLQTYIARWAGRAGIL